MSIVYFDKTEKGREEISHRTFHLSAKLRPLLVIVDGKHTSEELLKNVQGLGLTQSHLDSLLSEGFITGRVVPPHSSTPINNTEKVGISPERIILTEAVIANPTNMMEIKAFFNEAIKSNLGLRGFGLQLRVEKAESRTDLIELRLSFLDAVEKSKGTELANKLALKIDQLMQQ